MTQATSNERRLSEHRDFARRLAAHLLGDLDVADDVAQDAMLAECERSRRTGAGLGDSSWMRGVVRNLTSGRTRDAARRRWFEQDYAHTDKASPERTLDAIERVTAAARALDDPYRRTIIRRFLQSETYEAIASADKISVAAVRQRVSRALAQMRERLEQDLGGSSKLRAALAPLVGTRIAVSKVALVTVLGLAGLGGGIWLSLGLVKNTAPHVGTVAGRSPAGATQDSESAALAAPGPSEAGRSAGVHTTSPSDSSVVHVPAGGTTLRVVDASSGEPLEPSHVVLQLEDGSTKFVDVGAIGVDAIPKSATALAARSAHHNWAWAELSPDEGGTQVLGLDRCSSVLVRASVGGEPSRLEDCLLVVTKRDEDRPSVAQSTDQGPPPGPLLAAMGQHPVFEPRRLQDGGIRFFHNEAKGAFELEPRPGLLIRRATGQPGLNRFGGVIRAGGNDVEVELERTLTLGGRLLWSDDRAPVAEAVVEVAVLFADGTKSYRTQSSTDEEGRFSAYPYPYADPFRAVDLFGIRIEAHPVHGAAATFVLDAESLTEDLRLPELLVDRVEDVFLRITDVDGQPVEGALVAGDLHRDYGVYRWHRTTDGEGLATVPGVALDVAEMVVIARGFQTALVRITESRGSAAAPIELAVSRANALRFELKGAASGEDMELVLEVPPPLLRVERDLGSLTQLEEKRVQQLKRLHEIAGVGAGLPPRPQRSLDWDSESQAWHLWDLVPGATGTARLEDASGHPIAEAVFGAPPRGESATVILRTLEEAATMTGHVEDERGEPVPDVRVGLRWPSGSYESLGTTSADGAFVVKLPGMGRTPQSISVRGAGFVERTVLWGEVAQGTELRPIRLQTARSILVRLLEPGGTELPPTSVRAESIDADGDVTEHASSYLDQAGRLNGLPKERAIIHARVGGRTYSGEVSPSQDEVVLQVPAHGRLRVVPAGPMGPSYDQEDARRMTIVAASDPSLRLDVRIDQPGKLALAVGEYVVEDTAERFTIEPRQETTWTPPDGL